MLPSKTPTDKKGITTEEAKELTNTAAMVVDVTITFAANKTITNVIQEIIIISSRRIRREQAVGISSSILLGDLLAG